MDVTTERDAVAALIRRALAANGRGAATALATRLGLSDATITKWHRGMNLPDRSRWPEIEDALNLPAGSIARAAGFADPDDELPTQVQALAERVDAVVLKLDGVMATLERLTAALPNPDPVADGPIGS